MIKLVRSNSKNPDFIFLVKQLDAYLKITDGDEHDFYNQFNAIDSLKHVVVAFIENKPAGCGAFKEFNTNTVEIKRMFILSEARRKGMASRILNELENWAKELNYSSTVLETGVRQIEAVQFYKKNNYLRITNYGQYKSMKNSLCFEKKINNAKSL